MKPRGSKRWKRAEKLPFQWAIEGDIKACFDSIDHHALMVRVRRRVVDAKLTRLIKAFLKAGAMSEAQLVRSDSGTPQGGILSPLLANIALGALMHCAFCREPLGYVHGHAACLRGGCPMFGVNQAECCAGDQGQCVPTSTAAAGPPGAVIGTRGAGPDKTAR